MNENIVNSVIIGRWLRHWMIKATDNDGFPVRMATFPVDDADFQQVGSISSDDSLSKAAERFWACENLKIARDIKNFRLVESFQQQQLK